MNREPPLPYGPPDRFGIPARMFGPVPEEFYGLIGRVTMVAALLEDRLVVLLTEMTSSPQTKYAGTMAGQSIKLLDKELHTRLRPEFVAEGLGLLARLGAVFERATNSCTASGQAPRSNRPSATVGSRPTSELSPPISQRSSTPAALPCGQSSARWWSCTTRCEGSKCSLNDQTTKPKQPLTRASCRCQQAGKLTSH